MLRKVNTKLVSNLDLKSLFFITFIIQLIVFSFITSNFDQMKYIIIILDLVPIYCIYIYSKKLIKSLYIYKKNIRNLSYFYIDSNREHLNQYKNIISIYMKFLIVCFGIVICIDSTIELFSKDNSFSPFFKLILYVFSFLFAILFTRFISKTKFHIIAILSSTLIGSIVATVIILSLLFLILGILAYIPSFLMSYNINVPDYFYKNYFMNIINVIIAGIALSSEKSFFIFSLILSLVIQITIFYSTPAFWLSKIKNEFTYVNYAANGVLTLILFFSSDIASILYRINTNKDIQEIIEISMSTTKNNQLSDLLANFSNVIIIPYIFVSLVVLILITKKEAKYENKAEIAIDIALESIQNNEPKEKIIRSLKEFIYYGGKTARLSIKLNDKLNVYLQDLLISKNS